jgi:hypothetical protein
MRTEGHEIALSAGRERRERESREYVTELAKCSTGRPAGGDAGEGRRVARTGQAQDRTGEQWPERSWKTLRHDAKVASAELVRTRPAARFNSG